MAFGSEAPAERDLMETGWGQPIDPVAPTPQTGRAYATDCVSVAV